MQEYEITLKDYDGRIYTYKYHKFTEGPEGLMIYKAGGMTNEGTREMVMMAKFNKCDSILEIVEVEDEIEG